MLTTIGNWGREQGKAEVREVPGARLSQTLWAGYDAWMWQTEGSEPKPVEI